ncbi:5-(carboxyamino)imidazole ribonucleotide synthase [Beijerinckia indica]|uniref:N5-carboxyaminoimidazole ribonucleotide synthase n=1 Tax=Beijerinckia indica subsp. indica (strain ATCC 9039 / DSM 1715 / NCIMB 8712) TaxID=395963 RepID=B2IE68_BEII9|nr:5-(carboxyamino)imidazole ribonucleotide synthase [Beijerinckia indica]ACB94092.1 phosphoribosylaminoimidazole carboxylase, ATPase subunit [Beijerinckia indica subsp. indica ATCC 9039]
MSLTLTPNATIGILGGGQLGRMLALAAARLGLKSRIYAPEADSPAFVVAAGHMLAAYEDEEALAQFAAQVDVITYEFENVPARTAAVLAKIAPVLPGEAALAASQDRLVEKDFMASLGIATAPYRQVDDVDTLKRALAEFGRPAILKTRRFGYDGKGQVLIGDDADPAAAFHALGGQPAILEGFVPFSKEISVVAARGVQGEFAAFDVCENIHRHHILQSTHVPARVDAITATKAVNMAKTIADALDYVGILAVELFLVEDPASETQLLVNEIAPRVHNSGHWTEGGAVTSQFEQHIRAIAGWPLGSTKRHGSAVTMQNLIGDDVENYLHILAEPGACLTLYGKQEARTGRKMGHVTRIIP